MNGETWRCFRLFLIELSDKDLERVEVDAARETEARIERDQGITRLFFTSLSGADLSSARIAIRLERIAREEDAAILRALAAGAA